MEEFEKEEESIFPLAGETLVEFLLKKQKAEKEVMLCTCYGVVFDKLATKAIKASKIRNNFQQIQEVNAKGKEKQNISMTVSQVQSPYSFS